jgi:hypothetical protein
MASITTRAGKGSPLTNAELDANFTNINNGITTSAAITGGSIDGVTLGTNSPVTEADVDNINLNGNTISITDTNGDLTLTPNGTGGLIVSGTNSVTLPNGTEAQRDGTPASGMLRFNTDTNVFEGYDGTAWGGIGGGAEAGGSIVTNSDSVSVSYTIAAGENGFSVGPVTIESGVSITVSAGQRWLVL